jgi:hypothetical protein
MSLKPVWAVLATADPLAGILAGKSEVFMGPDIVARLDDDGLYVSRVMSDGSADETRLILREPSGDLESVGWDVDERARLLQLGDFRSALTLEARDADIAVRVIEHLCGCTALAIDNDNGEILSGAAFKGLSSDRQRAFLGVQ